MSSCARCRRVCATTGRSDRTSKPLPARSATGRCSLRSSPKWGSSSEREAPASASLGTARGADPEASVPGHAARVWVLRGPRRRARVGDGWEHRQGDRRRRGRVARRLRLGDHEVAATHPAGGRAAHARRRRRQRVTVAPSVDALVESLAGDLSSIRAPRGTTLNARSWATEAPLRMLLNNLDAEVAERPEDLVVYGGTGRAARSHDALKAIVRALLELGPDETLLVQSGKPVAVFRTTPSSPRVLIANSLLVPKWATWDEFRRLEAEGLTMFGQMTAGSWIYIGTQGILQGTYQTFAAAAHEHYGEPSLAGRTVLTAGLGGMGGAQSLAATMAGGAILCIEVDPARIERRLETRYLDQATDSLEDALARVRAAADEG